MKVFIFDSAKCNGCYNCQIACKDEHVDNEWMPYTRPQPDTGQFWLKINETVHGQVPKVRVEYRPILCMHCDNPVCMKGADGAVYKRENGLVLIDPIEAKGRKDLVASCPYGVIYWNEALNIPQKCTGCAHLVDEGKLPHCVDLCPTGALRFGEEEEFADEITRAEVLKPEKGLMPRVYFLNLPKLFIGGEVWDPSTDEVIEGAIVTLINERTNEERETQSDCYGDFWFKQLNPGNYTIHVRAKGFQDVAKIGITLNKSLNIGDFALVK